MDLMLWDNTPGDVALPAGFAGVYHHDRSNPGLAAAYKTALQHAINTGAEWLMLLDQDTAVTEEYLAEVLTATKASQAAALVPRLTCNGRTISPFLPVTVGPPRELADDVVGKHVQPLQAFNSGAVLSVAALQAAGGFDTDFPIDYLDHATFTRLQRSGGQIEVLHTRLEHALASQAPGPLGKDALRRERDILAGERRYFRKYGTALERRQYPLRMLRRAASVIVHKRDFRNAGMMLRAMLGLAP